MKNGKKDFNALMRGWKKSGDKHKMQREEFDKSLSDVMSEAKTVSPCISTGSANTHALI